MKRLLYINASPRGTRSRSGAISETLLKRLSENRPALEIEQLDLFTAELPPFDAQAVEGRYHLLAGNAVEPQQAEAWQALRRWTDHFLSFDAWLFATPMWNFGIPYRLKHYVDVLTHPGFTFALEADGNVKGLAAGRTAIIVAASALPFGSVPDYDAFDYQLRYLQAWLGFIGVTDIRSVRIGGTYAPPEQIEAAMADARTKAKALADLL